MRGSTRREFLQGIGAGVALMSLPAWVRAAEGPGRPNVVLIVSDDQGWTDYAFMGHPQVQTPHLDRLASQSACFTHGYVPTPLCCPSLATILTGRYPHQHRIVSNDPPLPPAAEGKEKRGEAFRVGRERMNAFMDAQETLPRVLGRAGYLSYQTGKWWQGNFRRGGFTHGMTHGEAVKGGRHGDAGLAIGRQGLQPVYDFVSDARGQRKPFFLWYAPMLPHQPHNPPERLLQKYTEKTPSIHIARYWAMVEWFDETCGELLGYLEKEGLAENTIVAYVVDNGWVQRPNAPAPTCSKLTPYDAGLRTPIMLRWPGHITPQKCETPVSSIDLAPTLFRAAGVDAPANLPGVNLLDAGAVAGRDALVGAVYTHNAVDLDDPSKGVQYRWCLAGGWKLIDPNPALLPEKRAELYHVAIDPHEKDDLAEREPARVQDLRKRLAAFAAAGYC